jgi:iron complex transport system substrate-binding protein
VITSGGMRVVSLAPSATEIVFALGCGDQLVGRTAFCDYPPEAVRIPAVGGWTTANLEKAVALQPDLVLTSTFLQDTLRLQLERQGIAVCHADPHTLDDVLESFSTIADALGVPSRGVALRTRVASEFESLLSTPHSPHPRVYAEEWPDPPMASGNWVTDLIRHIGGIPLLPSGQPSRRVELDEVAAFDPELIMLNYCGMAAVPTYEQVRRFRARPAWSSLRAAHAGRILAIDDSLLNRPGPRLTEGARILARAFALARAA